MSNPKNMQPLPPSEVAEPDAPIVPVPVPAPAAERPMVLDFLAGLPALLAVLGMLIVLGAAVVNPPTAAYYAAESKRRIEKGDVPGAMVCARRVFAMNPADSENRYNMITLLVKSGDLQRADALALSMVEIDDAKYDQLIKEPSGYPIAQAHMYLAERMAYDAQYLRRNVPRIEQHLRKYIKACRATGRSKEAVTAEGMLGEVYAQADYLKEARSILERTSENNPMRLLRLGDVCDRLRDHEIAARHYQAAIQAARNVIGESPENRPARIAWALSLMGLKEHADALKVLNEAYELTREDEYHKIMARICLDWIRTLRTGPGNPGDKQLTERLKIAEKGLNYDPTNLELLSELAAMMDVPGKEAEEAKKILNGMVATSQSAGISHFFLGNDAWKHQKFDVARTHWEEAFKLESKMPIIANNLAFLLAFREPTDEKRALSIVDQALAVQGSSPMLQGQLLGTRGQILAKMGNWKEALTSLEASLKADQKTPGIHAALAETYEHLGMSDLAAEHKRIVESLAKSKAPANEPPRRAQ